MRLDIQSGCSLMLDVAIPKWPKRQSCAKSETDPLGPGHVIASICDILTSRNDVHVPFVLLRSAVRKCMKQERVYLLEVGKKAFLLESIGDKFQPAVQPAPC